MVLSLKLMIALLLLDDGFGGADDLSNKAFGGWGGRPVSSVGRGSRGDIPAFREGTTSSKDGKGKGIANFLEGSKISLNTFHKGSPGKFLSPNSFQILDKEVTEDWDPWI